MISFHLAESLFCCSLPADFIFFGRLVSNILFFIIFVRMVSNRLFGHRLGSDRGFGRPYRERPDRCFSIDEDEDGPRYPEDDF